MEGLRYFDPDRERVLALQQLELRRDPAVEAGDEPDDASIVSPCSCLSLVNCCN